jgi:mercuric ion binding protein
MMEMINRILTAAALVTLAALGSASAAERTVTLTVDGMYCAACPYIVRKSLAGVPGVGHVEVSFEAGTATVTFDDATASVEALTDATGKAGYPSRLAGQES